MRQLLCLPPACPLIAIRQLFASNFPNRTFCNRPNPDQNGNVGLCGIANNSRLSVPQTLLTHKLAYNCPSPHAKSQRPLIDFLDPSPLKKALKC
jgi:hypothetical protein